MAGANILIKNIPEGVSAKTLRKDIGELVKSYGGKRTNYNKNIDVYSIPHIGGLILLTNDSMSVNCEDIFIGDDEKLNAVVSLLPHKENVLYIEIRNKLENFSEMYK